MLGRTDTQMGSQLIETVTYQIMSVSMQHGAQMYTPVTIIFSVHYPYHVCI